MDDIGCVIVILQPFKFNQDLLSRCYIQFNDSFVIADHDRRRSSLLLPVQKKKWDWNRGQY